MLDPTAPLVGSDFRLQKICELQKALEAERDNRNGLYKKYKRALNVVDGLDTALLTSSVSIAVIGALGVVTNVVSIPISAVLGVLGGAGKIVNRRLLRKVKKHCEIAKVAESKLNTIANHVSKALKDGSISDEEFKLILDEFEKYTNMKGEIRSQTRKILQVDEETKNELIQRGRDQARASFMAKLAGNSH